MVVTFCATDGLMYVIAFNLFCVFEYRCSYSLRQSVASAMKVKDSSEFQKELKSFDWDDAYLVLEYCEVGPQ